MSNLSAGAWLMAGALAIAGCNSPAHTIKPVIYAYGQDKYQAMKSASVIVVAETLDCKWASGSRDVKTPSDAFNPKPPMAPLRLVRSSANVLLSLRGDVRGTIQFYSWVWALGTHGGARLFRPYPGYYHVLFLRQESGYLHTVGDYPAYDLEIPRRLVPTVLAGFKASPQSGSDLFEKIAMVLIRAELDNTQEIGWNYMPAGWDDLEGLTSKFYVAGLLDSFCLHLANRFGRFAACEATADMFYGRCEAYRLARAADSAGVETARVSRALAGCEAQEGGIIGWLRTNSWTLPPGDEYGWLPTTERRRLAMRLYASAMDPKFRAAACEAAATMPELRDIPECSATDKTETR